MADSDQIASHNVERWFSSGSVKGQYDVSAKHEKACANTNDAISIAAVKSTENLKDP